MLEVVLLGTEVELAQHLEYDDVIIDTFAQKETR